MKYELGIPTDTFEMLKMTASREGTTVAELLRRATRLVVFFRHLRKEPDTRLLIERGGEIREIVLDWL